MEETRVAFISGPTQLDQAYFDNYYKPQIDNAIAQNHKFVMGPARGVDSQALKYLLDSGVDASRITVYLGKHQAYHRDFYRDFEESGGNIAIAGYGQPERDEACTRNSHYDILRYRPEDEARLYYGSTYIAYVTNTEMNERRRKTGIGLDGTKEGDGTGTVGQELDTAMGTTEVNSKANSKGKGVGGFLKKTFRR